VSSNLKGDLQRALRVAASLTVGMTDVLRTRADETGVKTGSEEMHLLKEQVEVLRSTQEKTTEDVNAMKAELEKAKITAAEAEKKAKRLAQELQDSIRKNRELKQKLWEAQEEMQKTELTEPIVSTSKRRNGQDEPEPEPMEVEVALSRGGDDG